MGSSCSKSDTPKKLGPIIICQSISKFLDINKEKHKNVIEKGPLFCVYSHDKKQEDSLPNSSLKIRDEDGNEAELYFETDAIFLILQEYFMMKLKDIRSFKSLDTMMILLSL